MCKHARAWTCRKAKAIGQKCEKPWENQGFAAERTGTELFDVFPIFSEVRTAHFCREFRAKLSSTFEEVLDLDGLDAVNGRDGFKTES